MIAYALRADFEGTTPIDGVDQPLFLGGLLAIGDDRDFNVADELAAGGGRIVVEESDTALVIALDEYPPLKRVAVEDTVAPTVDQYDALNVAALDDELRRRGIGGLNAAKSQKVAALHADDARIAAGDAQPDPYTVVELTGAAGEPGDVAPSAVDAQEA